MTSLAVSAYSALCVPYFLLVDAELDPRPVVDRVLVAVGPVLHDAREALRQLLRTAVLTAAALLCLTIPTGESR